MAHIIEFNLDIGKTKPDNVHHQQDYCPFCDVAHLTNVMETRGSMIWLENNALWAGLVVIAAAVGIMVIWKKHRED